jgi:hypothetical protein
LLYKDLSEPNHCWIIAKGLREIDLFVSGVLLVAGASAEEEGTERFDGNGIAALATASPKLFIANERPRT